MSENRVAKQAITAATGSTGKALQDSGARALVAAAVVFGVRFAEARLDVMTDSELTDLLTFPPSLMIVGAGVFDQWGKPRLAN